MTDTHPVKPSADIDMDAPVNMTNREAIQDAHSRLTSVVEYCLNLDLKVDQTDIDNIRRAHQRLTDVLNR